MQEKEIEAYAKKAADKDKKAMEILYREFFRDAVYICSKFGLNREDSMDIAQNSFITAFSKLSDLEDKSKFKSWLFRIVNNKCLDFIRHNKVIDISETDSYEEAEELPSKEKTPEEIIIDKEISEFLSGIIQKLPYEQRLTVFLYYYQDYSVKEIAQIFKCSDSTVRSRLNYARKFMQNEIDNVESEKKKARCIVLLPFLFEIFSDEQKVFACEIPDFTKCLKNIPTGGHIMKTGKIIGITAAAVATAGGIAAAVYFGGIQSRHSGQENSESYEAENHTTGNNSETVKDSKAAQILDKASQALSRVDNMALIYSTYYSGFCESNGAPFGISDETSMLVDTKNLMFEKICVDEYDLYSEKYFIEKDSNGKFVRYDCNEDENRTTLFKSTILPDEWEESMNYVTIMTDFYESIKAAGAEADKDNERKIICNTSYAAAEPLFNYFGLDTVTEYCDFDYEISNFNLMDYSGEITLQFDENYLLQKLCIDSKEIQAEIIKCYDMDESDADWLTSQSVFYFGYNKGQAKIPDIIREMSGEVTLLAEYTNGEPTEYVIRFNLDDYDICYLDNEKIRVSDKNDSSHEVLITLTDKDYDEREADYPAEDAQSLFTMLTDYNAHENDITLTDINGHEVLTAEYINTMGDSIHYYCGVKYMTGTEERIICFEIIDGLVEDGEYDKLVQRRNTELEKLIEAVTFEKVNNPVQERKELIDDLLGL